MQINEGVVHINTETDLIDVRKAARDISTQLGFGLTDITRIITAVSELARNIYNYAKKGMMLWKIVYDINRRGVEFIFEDHGPGIPDIPRVLAGGYTTGKGLGLGISGAKRLMDFMEIESQVGKGTKITIKKWIRG